MKRLSIFSALLLALSLFILDTGLAAAAQVKFSADPKAVWASCGAGHGGAYGSYDETMGVVCVHPGCDGNPKHSCIVDCDAGGNCTGTTPDRLVGALTLNDILGDHPKLGPAIALPDSGTPQHGGTNGGGSGIIQ